MCRSEWLISAAHRGRPMKQAVKTAPGRIEIDAGEKPQPGPGQELLQIWRTGVCNSAVHLFVEHSHS
jgi:threonine dehydrogenase-like Zn-dependent dehydrogenase